MTKVKKISTCLWFDDRAEEAVNFYTSVFSNSKILSTSYYQSQGNEEKKKVLTITFEIEGQNFIALNGGPHFTFTPAISISVSCETQEEVDILWSKLTEGGKESKCAWLEDKYGLSWQIVPTILGKLLGDPDPIKAKNVMEAMLKMQKIDIKALQEAYDK